MLDWVQCWRAGFVLQGQNIGAYGLKMFSLFIFFAFRRIFLEQYFIFLASLLKYNKVKLFGCSQCTNIGMFGCFQSWLISFDHLLFLQPSLETYWVEAPENPCMILIFHFVLWNCTYHSWSLGLTHCKVQKWILRENKVVPSNINFILQIIK